MRQTLRLHPESSCSAVTHIEAEVLRRQANSLAFAYIVTGTISDLALPPIVAAARTDELWRHTCFEAFLGSSLGAADHGTFKSRALYLARVIGVGSRLALPGFDVTVGALSSDQGSERSAVVLGIGSSARQGGFPPF